MAQYPEKQPSYNLYTPEYGEKVYAYPTYKFDKYDSQNRPIYNIDITGFNNWHAVLGWKYMGKNEYDIIFPSNKKPGYDSNIGFQANDWDKIYYISGKEDPDYPLDLKESGDIVSVDDLYRENARNTLAGVFEDFYNCPYYKDLQPYIKRGKDACQEISKRNTNTSSEENQNNNLNELSQDICLIAANTIIEKDANNIINFDFMNKDVQDETSAELLRDILVAIAVIDDNIVFNFVQKQDLWS